MSGIKTKQLESNFHQKLSEIIMELDNDYAKLATVTQVILNSDNSIAKVYISFIKENDEKSFFELKKATSYIRKELSNLISIKKVPFLELILDNKLNRINEMEQLIKKINKK
ncbi:MAG: 30S ribosome-binding factor RbfA [Mycoplasmataceae bacterium]|nr:30S ribosome-binding factor RbfA [Mycoplasmataceae bacterium]